MFFILFDWLRVQFLISQLRERSQKAYKWIKTNIKHTDHYILSQMFMRRENINMRLFIAYRKLQVMRRCFDAEHM